MRLTMTAFADWVDSDWVDCGLAGGHVTIVHVPPEKIELIDGSREVQLDPGSLIW